MKCQIIKWTKVRFFGRTSDGNRLGCHRRRLLIAGSSLEKRAYIFACYLPCYPNHGAKAILQKENLAWLYVIMAGVVEIIWASGLKYEEVPLVVVIISLIVSFDLLIRSAKVLPVGTMYAVFTAIGTVGTVVVESVASGSVVSPAKVVIILVLLLCVIGLKLTSDEVQA